MRGARAAVLVIPAAIYFLSNFHRVAPAVVAADLMKAFSITAASLGALAAIYPYVFAVMALVGGSLVETLGPRLTIASGATTMALGAALFGLAPVFVVAVAGRLLVGLGASVILIAWLTLAAEWYRPQQFATISGWTQTIGNVGTLMASSPLALAVEVIGWRSAFVLVGGVTLLPALAALLLVRDRPEAAGLPAVNPERRRPAPSLADVLASIPEVLTNAQSWPPVLAAAGVYATLIAFLGLWGVPYLTQVYGLGRVGAANIVAWLAVGIVVGAPLVGWLSDRRLGLRRLPLSVGTGLYAACWLVLVTPGDVRLPATWLPPLFLFMGLTASSLILVWSCVREVNNPAHVGIVIGFCNAPIFLAFALIQWLTGAILDAKWTGLEAGGVRIYPESGYRTAFGVCLALAAGSLVMSLFVTETRCRNIWRRAAH
ncbi:MAG TPA: MFS transporter [Candidatus Binatia bacterium]|nr:MFS transporter [Candidatus Binatia bacterium]